MEICFSKIIFVKWVLINLWLFIYCLKKKLHPLCMYMYYPNAYEDYKFFVLLKMFMHNVLILILWCMCYVNSWWRRKKIKYKREKKHTCITQKKEKLIFNPEKGLFILRPDLVNHWNTQIRIGKMEIMWLKYCYGRGTL